ncbi:hypothetical protein [Nocardioides panaciterrulae]|uniref:Uncharacterized protein n=1 Tax=Nocardioides panaciterrulae TaxID=661492 RepID=A0A7Y9E3Y3_9ACTN|nr:hypothetical protein [Nocardioides panaciterrulae]NYD40532.1 hypothetical protein [Nocardioides panaciterrulae]
MADPRDPAGDGPGLRLPAYLEPVPAGTPDLPIEVTFAALEPASGRFRSNVVVTEQPTGGLGFRDWQAGTDELLPRTLPDYLLVDLERLELDGHPAGRRLAHHAGPAGEALTMEQWFVLVDGVGHTLTATVETWRYDELADSLAGVAASWRPAGEGA